MTTQYALAPVKKLEVRKEKQRDKFRKERVSRETEATIQGKNRPQNKAVPPPPCSYSVPLKNSEASLQHFHNF